MKTAAAEATITAADLVHLGFSPEPAARPRRHETAPRRHDNWFTGGHIRVALNGDDGTEVFVFRTTPAHGLLEWSMRFDGNVPARVIRAAIFSAMQGR